MNRPLIPSITVQLQRFGSLFIAIAYDETGRYRGDCISGDEHDVDQWTDEWKDKTLQLIIEKDASPVCSRTGQLLPLFASRERKQARHT